ncbi:MAG: sulfurtransferase [Actinomycetia bacterium]|nr:sulfurtransferase [Actinomycetes bacterium]
MTIPVPPIVSPRWLQGELDRGTRSVKVADVRSYLDGRSGRDAYDRGHLPSAVFVDLDQVLAAPASPELGRHPMPSPEVFAMGLGQVGIGDDDIVVAYDDLGGMIAGRLVWMLRILGAPAALLDGGLPAWPDPLESTATSLTPVERTVRPWPASVMASIDEVAEAAGSGTVVVDSRATERYRGEQEPIDPRAGHVPGAVNLPYTDNLDDQGRFRSPEELAALFASVGADGNAIVYCGSGVSACHNLLAMERAGIDPARLFVGSWSQWSSDPSREAATGATEG